MRVGALALILFLVGCGGKDLGPDLSQTKTGELSGEVFIVTQGGQNFKLGLVAVEAIPEIEIHEFLKQKSETAARQSAAIQTLIDSAVTDWPSAQISVLSATKKLEEADIKLQSQSIRCTQLELPTDETLRANPQFSAALNAVADARLAVASADREVQKVEKIARAEYHECIQTHGRGACDAGKPSYELVKHNELWAQKQILASRQLELEKLRSNLRTASYEACIAERVTYAQAARAKQNELSARKEVLALGNDRLAKLRSDQEYLRTSAFYFTDLPAGIASAKTNADGQFTMSLPRTGRFALAARASRRTLNETENYYWLVWVSLNGAEKMHFMLANDNLTTSGSTESVVTLAN